MVKSRVVGHRTSDRYSAKSLKYDILRQASTNSLLESKDKFKEEARKMRKNGKSENDVQAMFMKADKIDLELDYRTNFTSSRRQKKLKSGNKLPDF